MLQTLLVRFGWAVFKKSFEKTEEKIDNLTFPSVITFRVKKNWT